jgi:hypothetical protein
LFGSVRGVCGHFESVFAGCLFMGGCLFGGVVWECEECCGEMVPGVVVMWW